MNTSLSLHSAAVQYARKLIGVNTIQSSESFKLARLLIEPFCFSKPSSNRIRLHASPLRFKSVRLEGSIVYLDGFQFDGLERQLKPFAVRLNGDRSLFEAVLKYMGFTEAMMCLHGFVEELLAGKPTLSSIISLELNTDLLI